MACVDTGRRGNEVLVCRNENGFEEEQHTWQENSGWEAGKQRGTGLESSTLMLGEDS